MKKKYNQFHFSHAVLFVFFLMGGINTAFSQMNKSIVSQTITDKIVKDLTRSLPDSKLVDKNLATIKPDGSWPDIEYSSKEFAVWPPEKHLVNIQTLIKAYVTKNSSYYADDKVFKDITNALQYWYNLDPKSDNWWWNQICTPKSIGESLIMMNYGNKKIDALLQQKLIERMKQSDPEKWTGANKTDIAQHFFYRALLTEDDALLNYSLKEFFSPVSLVYKKEGMQYDNSYMQHGLQLYVGGYGTVFLEGVFKVANYVNGTPYTLSSDKMALLSKFFKDTYLKTIRSKYSDFSVMGRSLSRPNALDMSGAGGKLLLAKEVDPLNRSEWDAAQLRISGKETPSYKITAAHNQYFNSDYALHQRPSYSFNVRMASKRTIRCETGNNENLLGRYISNGATNIQITGPEYYNIMPVWEWDKIPGITSRDYVNDKIETISWGESGSNDFAGGVSDGVYGANGYMLNFDNLQAKKAWFFFDNEIVCLGTDIKSDEPENVNTTINQCWLKGDTESSLKNNPIAKDTIVTSKDKSKTWFLHDNVGYYFPQGGDITLSTNVQKGNWYHINNSYSKDEITGNVFKLWLDHGVKPQNAEYAYIVLPGVKSEKEMNKFKANELEIIANNSAIQAVYHKPLDILQLVFYEPGSIKVASTEIKVDKPCILMIKNFSGQRIIAMADPLYKETTATLTLTNTGTKEATEFKVDFPQNEYAGSTVEVKQ
ncbi:chondroitinase-AC [Flavobacterium sp. WC2509]|uniref:chondroitinase-AC n=1 Tax=Flavobacterium sp. WC2509 TaxID=3461406 RepID=UPI00404466A6